MKNECLFRRVSSRLVGSMLSFGLIFSLAINLHAQNENKADFKVKPEDILASCHPNGSLQAFQIVGIDFSADRRKLVADLLEILNNPKSPNFDQCAAAYYLGEMRASEAADGLAAKIELRLDLHHVDMDGIPVMPIDFGVEAVVRIGNPSILALIRNLETSDDTQVRDLSLKALYRIEGDKDVVQLRLQKALKAETHSQKQARLQAALKAFPELN